MVVFCCGLKVFYRFPEVVIGFHTSALKNAQHYLLSRLVVGFWRFRVNISGVISPQYGS